MPKSKKPAHIAQQDWDAVDSPELSGEILRALKPASEMFPALAAAAKRRRGQRGPQKNPRKIAVLLRVDPKTLAAYKAGGPGYQTRMAGVLNKYAEKHANEKLNTGKRNTSSAA